MNDMVLLNRHHIEGIRTICHITGLKAHRFSRFKSNQNLVMRISGDFIAGCTKIPIRNFRKNEFDFTNPYSCFNDVLPTVVLKDDHPDIRWEKRMKPKTKNNGTHQEN